MSTSEALVAPDASAADLRDALEAGAPGSVVVVAPADIAADVVQRLASAAVAAGVATASPVPLASGPLRTYDLHPELPPPPSLALACGTSCAISVDAVASLGGIGARTGSAADQVRSIAVRQLQRGWRHVAAPGVALGWDADDVGTIEPTAAWSAATVADLVGAPNVGLETHVGWARTQLDGLRVVVDGACLDGDLHTGTQQLVTEVTRAMKRLRPDAEIVLAVGRPALAVVAQAFARSGIDVVERSPNLEADVLYRPYQMLKVDELDVVLRVGRRRLVGQLDMIGFSNPFYHPSPALFGFARNLQRHLMRVCDGVTFISDYGRDAALAECPDLELRRLHVVSCGADPQPSASTRPDLPTGSDDDFLLCLAATFWHKNRSHAIATFANLVESTGYPGALIIAGPEPFYGRSDEFDDTHLALLPSDVRSRVHRIGRVSDAERWWLLEHADTVLYPSVIEGFGLVPFEAAAVGTPSLSFAGTAPGELLGATAATIDTWAPGDWAARVGSWITDSEAADRVVREVAAVAHESTWERTAERTWTAIDTALALPPRQPSGEDGGSLARIAPSVSAPRVASTLRFTVARAQPAVQRRTMALVRRARTAAAGRNGHPAHDADPKER